MITTTVMAQTYPHNINGINIKLLEALKGMTKMARLASSEICVAMGGDPSSEEWEGHLDAVHGEIMAAEELIASAEKAF